MSKQLPPLDLHAHISPKARSYELERLGAVVFAATRSLDEYEAVRGRHDQVTVWGVGCHPAVLKAQQGYDSLKLTTLIASTACVSEVGLDGRSKVPMKEQERVFNSILEQVKMTPRIVSIHSSGATGRVLNALEVHEIEGAVLHWWRGTKAQTLRAIELGCWFSVNSAGMNYSSDIAMIPQDRILTETDHPYGDKGSPLPRQPGALEDVEIALARLYGTSAVSVRQQVWRNFACLVGEVEVVSILPKPVQRMIAAVNAT